MIYIYLLTAVGLSPGGSTHLHTNTQNNRNNNRTTQITTNFEKCGPCPVFASFTLAFALQMRKKHGKTSVRVKKKPRSGYFQLIVILCPDRSDTGHRILCPDRSDTGHRKPEGAIT